MDTIYPIVSQKDPGRTYITSSPSNGIKTINEGGLDGKPTSFRYGDYLGPGNHRFFHRRFREFENFIDQHMNESRNHDLWEALK